MGTLLKVQTSLTGADGQSSQLLDHLARQWLTRHPGGRVVARDLSVEPAPHLTAERFQAFSLPAHARTPAQQAAVEYSDTLIAELANADAIAFAAPMYNFGVPSTLHAYFDHIARAGVTFRYTADGPEGLIKGKKVYVVSTRGGAYAGPADTQIPYLRQFLGLLGMTDVEFIRAEGLAMAGEARERGLISAHHTIAKLLAPAPFAA